MNYNVIEILMMPGTGMLLGVLPLEDILRKKNAFAPLSSSQRILLYAVYAGMSALAAMIGILVFGTFSAAAIGGASAVLFGAFNPFARFRQTGFWSAAGATLVVSPFVIALFAIMYATGYGVLGKNKAIAMMSGIIGTALLAPTTPRLILHATEIVKFNDISEHTFFVLALCMTLFIRHLGDIRAVILEKMSEQYSDDGN